MSDFSEPERYLLTRAATQDGWLAAGYVLEYDETATYALIRAGLAEWEMYKLVDCWRLTGAGMKAAAELGRAA